jgi:hypothetical protein
VGYGGEAPRWVIGLVVSRWVPLPENLWRTSKPAVRPHDICSQFPKTPQPRTFFMSPSVFTACQLSCWHESKTALRVCREDEKAKRGKTRVGNRHTIGTGLLKCFNSLVDLSHLAPIFGLLMRNLIETIGFKAIAMHGYYRIYPL